MVFASVEQREIIESKPVSERSIEVSYSFLSSPRSDPNPRVCQSVFRRMSKKMVVESSLKKYLYNSLYLTQNTVIDHCHTFLIIFLYLALKQIRRNGCNAYSDLLGSLSGMKTKYTTPCPTANAVLKAFGMMM